MAARLKLFAALLLLLALALPMYTCQRFHAPGGEVVDAVPPGADVAAYKPYAEPHYALEHFDITGDSWLVLAVFVWPLVVVVIRARRGPTRLGRVLWWLEPLPIAGSIYVIWSISGLGDRASGAHVAFAAMAIYGFAWLLEFGRHRRPPPG